MNFLSKPLDRLPRGPEGFEFIGIMTLVLLLFHANETWYLRVSITVLALIGLLFRSVLHKASYWWILSFILAAVYWSIWDLWIVNHKFAITYWCLAIACGLLAPRISSGEDQAATENEMASTSKTKEVPSAHRIRENGPCSLEDPYPYLAVCSRILIGLIFAIATLWKIVCPEFPNGNFFHFTLLTDHRFLDTAELVGGVSPEMSQQNLAAVNRMKQPGPPPSSVLLIDTPSIPRIALFIAVWTIFIEGSIGLFFLWPCQQKIAYWRDWLLITFIITTYPIATVHGFAWLIVIMAFAQCSPEFKLQRMMYLALFIGMPLMDIPIPYYLKTWLWMG